METANKILSSDIQTLRNPESSTSTYLDIDRALAEIVDFVKTDDFKNIRNDLEREEIKDKFKHLVNLKFDVLHPSINLDDVKQLKTFFDSVRSMLGIENKTNYSVEQSEWQKQTLSELEEYHIQKKQNALQNSPNLEIRYTSKEIELINKMFNNDFEKIEVLEYIVSNFLPEKNTPSKFKHIHKFLSSEYAFGHNIHQKSYIQFVKEYFKVDGNLTDNFKVKFDAKLGIKSIKHFQSLKDTYSNFLKLNCSE